jgi:predicted 3-demethylubiquinone-9 3-methyltransferase (glyoxalase superfamily)
VALNGGPQFVLSEATSMEIRCESQAEVDFYWDALLAGGGEPSQCGWLKDRFGMSWQVTPQELVQLVFGPDPQGAARAVECMLGMVKLELPEIRAAYEGR